MIATISPTHSPNWYEATLPTHERKLRGHYSTPPLLVERILDACNYLPTNNLTHLRVLDPACGSGNFLLGAASRLLASAQRWSKSSREYRAILQRNLWGLDPDPVACCMAQMNLHTMLTPPLEIKRGAKLSLHIHQADALAIPWEAYQGIDLFLANPPYLATKNNDLSNYGPHSGQADSYLFFLNLALRVVRPGGWLCLVLPDALLARINAANERSKLLMETTIHHLWHLAGVFPAHVGAVVLIAQKQAPPVAHSISWQRQRWHTWATRTTSSDIALAQTIEQSLLRQQPHAELRYLLGSQQPSLSTQLHTQHCNIDKTTWGRAFVELGELVTIRRGEEIGKDSSLLSQTYSVDSENGKHEQHPVIRGGSEIQPYGLPVGRSWLSLQHITKPLTRYTTPKLLVVKSTALLQAALDMHGHVVLQTLYMLHLREKPVQHDDLYFLLALLNSQVLQQYLYSLYTAYKWVQPQIEQHVLARLPIPRQEMSEKTSIIARAKLLTRHSRNVLSSDMITTDSDAQSDAQSDVQNDAHPMHNHHYQTIYAEQERAICTLYSHALASLRT